MAALSVCAEKGYQKTRVEDIVARAGLSKGSLYHHFDSKRHLFIEMLGAMIHQVRDQMLALLPESPSAEHALRAFYRMFEEMVEKQPEMLAGLVDFWAMASRDAEMRRTFSSYYEELAEVLTRVIEQGQQSGEFSAELDVAEAAWTFITASDGVALLHAVLGDLPRGLRAAHWLLESTLQTLKRGLPPRDGDGKTEG